MDYTPEELMAICLARAVRNSETAGCGRNSPIPAAGMLIAKHLHAPDTEVIILGSKQWWPFSGPRKQFFDFANRGGFDLFHTSGGEIDVYGNVNLHVIGDYEQPAVRFPGAFGMAVMYFVAKRIHLFRTEHTPRALVEHVQFITCPANPPEGVRHGAGPQLLVTSKAVFRMDEAADRFRVESAHSGVAGEDLVASTGWRLHLPAHLPVTPPPTREELAALRGPVAAELRALYPKFVAQSVLV